MNNSISPRSLQEGEFVVHKKYGIGRFCGIKPARRPASCTRSLSALSSGRFRPPSSSRKHTARTRRRAARVCAGRQRGGVRHSPVRGRSCEAEGFHGAADALPLQDARCGRQRGACWETLTCVLPNRRCHTTHTSPLSPLTAARAARRPGQGPAAELHWRHEDVAAEEGQGPARDSGARREPDGDVPRQGGGDPRAVRAAAGGGEREAREGLSVLAHAGPADGHRGRHGRHVQRGTHGQAGADTDSVSTALFPVMSQTDGDQVSVATRLCGFVQFLFVGSMR